MLKTTTGLNIAMILLALAPFAQPRAQQKLTFNLGADSSLSVSLEERARWEIRDNADFDSKKDDTNNFVGNRLRIGLSLNIGKDFTLFAQGQDTRQWGSDSVATDLGGRYDDLRQAYVDIRNVAGVNGLALKVGRQELIYGEERLVGAFGWSNVGRSFDAFKVRYACSSFFVDTFVAGARQRPLIPDKNTQTLSGVYAGFFQNSKVINLDLYALFKYDSALSPGEMPGLADRTRIPTYGTRLTWKPVTGLKVNGEYAFQYGHKGPDTHRSNAQAVRIEYAFKSDLAPTIGVEYDRAKGDSSPYDGQSGSFDNLFPTNHNKYGLMDYHNWSNLRDLRVFASFRPAEWANLSVEGHDFRLDSASAPWTSAGGAVLGWDPAGLSGVHVGREFDVTASGDISNQVAWLAGWSIYWPGEFARATRGSDASRLAYFQMAVRF